MRILNSALVIGKREIILNPTTCAVIGVSFFVIFTISSAFIRLPLPFTPVPVTLQTFAVLLAGAVLGRKLGSLSQTAYIALGAAGLPIFAKASSGLAYLLGPTGGYLIGFVLAAWAIGKILGSKKAGFFRILGAMFIGELILFSLGVVWLALILKVGIYKAIFLGLLPFIPGDTVKLLAAATVYYEIQGRAREIYPG
jgi:biotin transport system substrate-specific component